MANYSEGRYIDRVAGADLSGVNPTGTAPSNCLFRIVSYQADATNPTGRSVVMTTSATDANILGVLNNQPVAGETASVMGRNGSGTFKVVVSANSSGVAIGDALTASSDSGAITTTTSTNQIIGYAQEAGAAGQVIEYLPANHKYGN